MNTWDKWLRWIELDEWMILMDLMNKSDKEWDEQMRWIYEMNK